jgi:hypothetical protein
MPVVQTLAPFGWMIELGAFPDEAGAKQRLQMANEMTPTALGRAEPFVERPMVVSGDSYRARFAHLDKEAAETACHDLVRHDMACVVVASPSRAATDTVTYPDGYVVLLTSQKSEAEARRHVRLVQAALEGKYLNVWRREPVIRDAELDDGKVYRGQVGPFRLLDEANRFCRELQFRCTVERTQAQPMPAAR